MCKALKYAENLINIFQEIENDIINLNQQYKETDLKQQDLLHMIEGDNFNASEGYCLAKTIKDTRINRRNYKNEIKTLIMLKTVVDKHINDFKCITGNIKREDVQLHKCSENKMYTSRVNPENNFEKLMKDFKKETKMGKKYAWAGR